jgi:hypothetical protein
MGLANGTFAMWGVLVEGVVGCLMIRVADGVGERAERGEEEEIGLK